MKIAAIQKAIDSIPMIMGALKLSEKDVEIEFANMLPLRCLFRLKNEFCQGYSVEFACEGKVDNICRYWVEAAGLTWLHRTVQIPLSQIF